MEPPDDLRERMVNETLRNRLIYWLAKASTVEAQIQYQRELTFAWAPGDLIFETDSWDFAEAGIQAALESSCSLEEIAAMESLQAVAWAAWEAIRDARPSIEAVQSMPEWIRLRELAASMQDVFAVRGPNAEAEKYWRDL